MEEEELEAAEALLELRNGVEVSGSSPYSWGSKRRRSAEEARPSLHRRFIATAFWAHGPVKPPSQEEHVKPEAASFSPDTPLCFSPGTDSSHDNIPTRRLKTKKLSANNDNNNNTEVKKAKYLRKLQRSKILKARKLEIINGTMETKEKSEKLLGGDDILSQRELVNPNPTIDDTRDLIPRGPINGDNPTTVTGSGTTYKPSTNGKEVSLVDVDVNVSPSLESFPPNFWDRSNLYVLDQVGLRRAMAAQARQRRMRIFRTKKNKRGL